ncbi:MAG: AAA family ATPase [Candidatus Rokubacteria bacterium]|nr:AAA family ATPase [Candidatus Rokubacteria bacterium]
MGASTRRYPALIEALRAPAVYPHPVAEVELVETHISWVLLAGERVYKLKKPVDLGFLDFTTLARRRFFCREEVRLNRRLAPDTYLGVVEIKGTARRPRLGGAGRTLEVAVEMRRLPGDRMLDRLVREGGATPEIIDAVATLVAGFHAGAETGGEIDEAGAIETVRRNWTENFAQTEGLAPDILPGSWRETLRRYVEGFLAREASRFAARVAGGHSRDCHGDLQAQHVCCTEPIQVFDCIEFNHRFRFGDTAGEIAFLAMDLERLGRGDLALRFLNAYLDESGDYGAVPLLDFYRAYRAVVRGKVLGFQVEARPEMRGEARALFALAMSYAERRREPRLVITSGVMGAGKSTVARAAAVATGAAIVRMDAVRKGLGGRPLRARAGEEFGAGLYTPAMGERTYAEALTIAGDVIRAGWPVVVDGSFSTADQRARARALADRLEVPFTVLWCQAPDAVIAARLRARSRDEDEISEGRAELLAAHRAGFEAPGSEAIPVDTTRALAAQLTAALPPVPGASR